MSILSEGFLDILKKEKEEKDVGVKKERSRHQSKDVLKRRERNKIAKFSRKKNRR